MEEKINILIYEYNNTIIFMNLEHRVYTYNI